MADDMTIQPHEAVDVENATKPQFTIYRARDAKDVDGELMPYEGLNDVDTAGIAAAGEAGVGEGAVVKLLFSDPLSGMSLTYAWLKANYQLPRHSHNVDCAYYIVSGEAHLGTEVLKAGDGFFVPKDGLYVYQAGPEGVEVVEFRTASEFHIKFSGNSARFWSRMAAISSANLDQWRDGPTPPTARRYAGEA